MNEEQTAIVAQTDKLPNALFLRYFVFVLRGLAFTVLLATYLLWTPRVLSLLPADNWRFLEFLQFVIFVLSLPAFGHLCTVRDRNRNFAAPAMPIMVVFVLCALPTLWFFGLSLSTFTDEFTFSALADFAAVISPVLAIALTMTLIIFTRLGEVWEPAPSRPEILKYWLYFAPALVLLACQGFSMLT